MGRVQERCPGERALSRAFPDRASDGLRAHMGRCSRCQRQWQGLVRLQETARAPVAPLADHIVDRIRDALVNGPPPALARPWPWRTLVVAAATMVAAAVLLVALRRAPVAPPPPVVLHDRGAVRALGAARFERQSSAPDELVRLHEGRIQVDVQPLAPGERFRVATADGEVEVRGTSFEVQASHDRLERVLVQHGRVEVRAEGRPVVVLGPQDAWPPPQPVPVLSPPRRRAAVARPGVESEADRSFRTGWQALSDGDTAAAIRQFDRAAVPGSGVAEDARFWRAVALLRGKRSGDARQALSDYLQLYPTSQRAPEASAMLGWLLLDAGQLDQAAARFRVAAGDSVPAVRQSGLAGLEAVRARR